jgi:hypothetical protein
MVERELCGTGSVAYPVPMTRRRGIPLASMLAAAVLAAALVRSGPLRAADALPSPEQFIGFPVGADSRLARWDRIVEYMRLAAARSDRVRLRELGPTTGGHPFIAVEISSPETLRDLQRYKGLERKLYFQGGAPSARERDEIFRDGKAVVLMTGGVHASEVGASQMALDLVYRLATDDSPAVRKILEHVVLLLVPSANPDGQILVTDWFNKNLGTPFEASPLPSLDHAYAGHDTNRDMYMLTQKESQYLARLAWHDWFPSVWLDQHQMGSDGARMFVMPASDPINPNVHPLIYRWNGILGQSQAAALEAAGKDGIIHGSTYTNFWQGALAWSGWWHNQIGLLTEAAAARVAAPLIQLRAISGPPPASRSGRVSLEGDEAAPLHPPTDLTPRTEYPRPWRGGRWTLRDVIDYQLIATMGLLETAADRRETLLRQIYEVNRQTVEERDAGDVTAVLVPADPARQRDPRQAMHLVHRLQLGGVEVYRAGEPFEAEGRPYARGTFVIPMSQVFARYAKDLLETQTYPAAPGGPGGASEPPYDVTAWSLGLLLGTTVDFVTTPVPAGTAMVRVDDPPALPGRVSGDGARFVFDYAGPDTTIAINRLLAAGARLVLEEGSRVVATEVSRTTMEGVARELGLSVAATSLPVTPRADAPRGRRIRAPRIGLYSPWTGGSIDEGWTRWVLEQYEFPLTTLHNAEVRGGRLRQRFDAIILPDETPQGIVDGYNGAGIRPEYRGGIGEDGVRSLVRFVAEGGTLIALGAASDLAIDRLSLPVRNLKRGMPRDRHSGPGTIVRLKVDTGHPVGFGMPGDTHGFYTDGPFFELAGGGSTPEAGVAARFPAGTVLASGWLRGADLMNDRGAVVSVEMTPGRVVLFGVRPQHRGQTQATFPLLFNALHLSGAAPGDVDTANEP